jgi:hypothetical protein
MLQHHDLERFQTDENISSLSVLGFTFDSELLAGDTDLRRKDTGVIRVSRRAIREDVERTQARLHSVGEWHEAPEERPLGLYRRFSDTARLDVRHVLVVATLDLFFEPSYALFVIRPYPFR